MTDVHIFTDLIYDWAEHVCDTVSVAVAVAVAVAALVAVAVVSKSMTLAINGKSNKTITFDLQLKYFVGAKIMSTCVAYNCRRIFASSMFH